MKNDLDLIKRLSEVRGISGNERLVARLFKNEVEDKVDSIEFDNLGSMVALKKGNEDEPKILFTAHMDEVGFVVAKILEGGFLSIHPVGGWWGHVILSQVMVVKTRDDKEYFGVVGSRPPHGMPAEFKNKVMDIKDMYLDMGVASKEEIAKLGIKVGDTVTPYTEFRVMNNKDYLMGKAFDDRIAVATLISAIDELKGAKTKANLYFAGTVQEEVGLRGARTASNMVRPDIAIAVDTTFSYDLPDNEKNDTKLGAGVALSIMDSSVIAHRALFDFVEEVAKKYNIKYTYDLLRAGGTDSGELSKSHDGAITMTLSIPCRYFHSHTSMINYQDYVEATKLVVAICKELDKETLKKLKESKY